MNTLHSYIAYYLLALNAVTFIVYGIPASLLIQIALMAYLHIQ